MAAAPGPLPPGQPRDALVAAVAAGTHHLDDGAAAVVACSGGPDSTALAFLVAEARPDLALTLVHVRHRLRDDAADAELARQHASWLGVDHAQRDVEVVRAGQGTEAAARRARYAALREVAAEVGAATLLVGHTADDQAETMLLRLARGTGLDGLTAMAPVAGDVTRPLLRVRRADVRRFVALEGLPCIEDPSNRDRAVRRALVRYELLPRLAEVGPDPVGALCRLAELARGDVAALTEAAQPLRERVRWVGQAAALPTRHLRAAPRSLAARVVREVLTGIAGQAPSATVAARVLEAGPAGRGTTSLPDGVQLTTTPGWWTLSPRRPATSTPVPVPMDGEVVWAPAGRVLRVFGPGSDRSDRSEGDVGQLPLELVGAWSPPQVRLPDAAAPPGTATERLALALPDGVEGLQVRHRQPGDRIVTHAGTKRVARAMGDAGLPEPLRALWPVVATDDRVVWIPGIAADREVLAAGRAVPARLLVLDLAADRSGARGVTGAGLAPHGGR